MNTTTTTRHITFASKQANEPMQSADPQGVVRPDTSETSQRKLRVLIADDSTAVQQSLSRLLADIENVEVAGVAQDAQEAIQAIQELKPEVVILDIRMPGESGLDVLERLHRASWMPKIIMLTNYPFVQYRKKCLEQGASFFFDKSSEFDQLPDALEQLRHTTSIASPTAVEVTVETEEDT